MTRISTAPLSGPEADARHVDSISAMRNGVIPKLFQILLHSGDIADAWSSLGVAVRYKSSLDNRLRELVICNVARICPDPYEWGQHSRIALDAGATPNDLESLSERRAGGVFSDRDLLALDFSEAVISGTVDDAHFSDVAQEFSEQEIVELIATTLYYFAGGRFRQAIAFSPD